MRTNLARRTVAFAPIGSPSAARAVKVGSLLVRFLSIILVIVCVGCPNGTTTCGSGIDVRNVDDSGVPAWIKEHILWEPGKIIGKFRVPKPGDPPQPHPLYPSGKIVVIRIATSDWPANSAATSGYINRIFFYLNSPGARFSRSVADYYRENSYGQFVPSSGGIPDWVTLGSLATYGDVESSIPLLKHVLREADVNWPVLDTNGDDVISQAEAQIVLLIPNGTPTSGYASKRDRTIGSTPTPYGWHDFGTRPIVYFSLKAESEPDSDVNPIRFHASVIHELHHAFFALPDRYGEFSGTGPYDHMTLDRSWLHLTMFDKMKIGWIQPKILNAHYGKCLRFPASESTPAALVLVKPEPVLVPEDPLEYWVVENRNHAFSSGGYDENLLEDGLAIWYVREGTYSIGHDEVHLVNAALPDTEADWYHDPYYGALFKLDPSDEKRLLLDGEGAWSFLWFQKISAPGQYMYGEF